MRHLLPPLAAIAVTAVAFAALPGARAEDPPADQRTPEQRRADAEQLFERLDKNRNAELAGDELPNPGWLERFDRDGDDVIRKKEMLEVIARGPGFDRLFIVRDPRARARNALAQFDQDKDGYVAAAEYPGDERTFRSADRDRDGRLEWKELVRLASDEIDDLRKRMKSPGRYEFLPLFDLDGDRQVTLAEYDGPARSFRKYDENGDDVVDYYEIYPQRRPRDMEATRPEPEDVSVLGALDKDGDGKVAREEWKGSESAWRRLDRNGDGWITSADAR